MGHRTYLLIQSAGPVEQLFEANNMLPCFWLGLLDQADLQAVAPQWHRLDQLEQAGAEDELDCFLNQWPSPTNLVLGRAAVAANGTRLARALAQHRPELVALHEEFMRYLLARLPHEADQLRLDVVALTAFSSPTECLENLHAELAALAQGQLPALATERAQVLLTGFPNGAVASGEYPVLSHLLALVSQPLPPPPPLLEQIPSRQGWFSLLGIMLAGVLLLVYSYRSFRHTGLTALVLLGWLVGAAVLAGGGAGLLARRFRQS